MPAPLNLPETESVEIKEYHLMTTDDFQNYCWNQAAQEVGNGHWVTALVLNGIQIEDQSGERTARQCDVTGGGGYNVYGNVEWSGLTKYIQPDEVSEIILHGTYVDNYTWSSLDLPWFDIVSFEYHIPASEFVFQNYDENWNTQEFCEVYFNDKAPTPPVEQYYTGTVSFTYGLAGETAEALPDEVLSSLPLTDGVYTISIPQSQLTGWTEANDGSYTRDFSESIPEHIEIDGVPYTLDQKDRTIAVSLDGKSQSFHYSATGVSFTLKKVDSEDSTKTLSGAQFTIYTDSTCNTSYTTVTTGEDGTVTVTLPVGQTYYMKETKAPEGYQIADTTVYELKTENNSSEGILSTIWAWLTGGSQEVTSPAFENGTLTVENVKILPVKYYVLSPDQAVPANGADAGYQNYFPNSEDPDDTYNYADGMTGTGLTTQLWKDLKGNNGVLEIGDQLLGFTSTDAGTLDDGSKTALETAFGLGSSYGNYEIVWYVVKVQNANKDGDRFGYINGVEADVHVDGYVKGAAVEIRYHDNYSTTDTYYTHAQLDEQPILTGSDYTVLDYTATGLTNRTDYTFKGWATSASGSVAYPAGSTVSPLKSDMDLYAVWEPKTIVPTGDPVLTVTKSADSSSVKVGDRITYTITVRNDGEGTATNVEVTDTLPTGVTYVSSDGSYDTDTRTVTWTVGTLNADESASFTVTVTADTAGTVTNTASATCDELANPATDSAAVTVNSSTSPVDPDDGDDDDDDNNNNNNNNNDDDDDDEIVNIEEIPSPLAPAPETDNTEEIPDVETPLTDAPAVPEDTEDTSVEITDNGVPMGSLPQTGTMTEPTNPTTTLGALALMASLSAAGLAVFMARKREDSED